MKLILILSIVVINVQHVILGTVNVYSVLDVISSNIDTNNWLPEDEILKLSKERTPDFIKYFGYPCETHEVTTIDKYILRLHRIPYGINGSIEENRPAVYLQHGFFSYSGDWFTNGPGKAIGFLLADAGYDVWVGNSRGNKYSRRHMHLDPDTDSNFWDFSWHEMGTYDLPATIDYILEYTQEEKLFYIGHSQGTTVYYVMLSERPEYNDKIFAQYSLAPIAYMKYLYGPGLKYLKYLENMIDMGADLLKIHELSSKFPIVKLFTKKICAMKSFLKLCITEVFAVTGFDYQQLNKSLLPIMMSNFPAGSSIKQLRHFAQEMTSGEFHQYDYGYEKNELVYGSYFAPRYNLSNIQAPIHLFYSNNDYLSSPKDVDRLFVELPEGVKYKLKVANAKWNHIDYLFGIDAKHYVYDLIFDNMKLHISP